MKLYLLSLLQVVLSVDIVGKRNEKVLLARNTDDLVLSIIIVKVVYFRGQIVQFRQLNDDIVVAKTSYINSDILLSTLNRTQYFYEALCHTI